MHTYYIERNNKLTGERGISRIDAQSLSMALYIAERMHGSLFTYKSVGSENTPEHKEASMTEIPKWLTTCHKIRNLILNILIASLPLAAFLALVRLIIGE